MTHQNDPITKSDIANLAISLKGNEGGSSKVSNWAIVMVASVSMFCSISAFVVFDNFATPRMLKQGIGKRLLHSLEDIAAEQQAFIKKQEEFLVKEEELLKKEEVLLERISKLEDRLEVLER